MLVFNKSAKTVFEEESFFSSTALTGPDCPGEKNDHKKSHLLRLCRIFKEKKKRFSPRPPAVLDRPNDKLSFLCLG